MIKIKRIIDVFFSISGLLIASPLLIPVMFLIWRQDGHSPFYIADRVGKKGLIFKMVKLRSMIVNADKSGVDSTSSSDNRITSLGRFIRKYKLDEITQLWNVLLGDMSLVGPRPNVKRETDLYTDEEKTLLKIKPGITDLASIVFADEGNILNGQNDPDIAYNQLIRPGKSHLGIFYVKHQTILLDIQLIFYTITLMFSREKTLKKIQNLLRKLNANDEIIKLASRTFPLKPMPPPGSSKIVTSRDGDPNK